MKMKNAEVEDILKFLLNFELSGRDSRLRTRFCKILIDRQTLISEEHFELIKHFANLDEDGMPKTNHENGRDVYDMKDRIAFQREYYMLLNEDFIIEENEERKEILLKVKEIILDCEMTFMGKEAMDYDRWCDIFEEIKYED